MAIFNRQYNLYDNGGSEGGGAVNNSSSVIRLWDKPVKAIRQFLCDHVDDVMALPTQATRNDDYPSGVPTGSEAIVAEDASVWILTNAGVWVDLTNAGSEDI